MLPTIRLANLAAIVGFATSSAAAAEFGDTRFDAPVAVRRVDLGPADVTPPKNKEVRCSYYPAFMVREVDEQELGDTQISILPVSGGAIPPCQRDNLPSERVISTDSWTGYFSGVIGDYAFFSAEDGLHGGMPFTVTHPPATNLLFTGIARGPLTPRAAEAGGLSIRFSRVAAAECSVIEKGADCARKVAAANGVAEADLAQCAKGYDLALRPYVGQRCGGDQKADPACPALAREENDESPTVIAYPAELSLTPTTAAIRPIGAVTACVPSE